MTFSRGYTLRRHELYSCHQVENKTTAENRGDPEVPTFSDYETDDEEIPYVKSTAREVLRNCSHMGKDDIISGSPEPEPQLILSDLCSNTIVMS